METYDFAHHKRVGALVLIGFVAAVTGCSSNSHYVPPAVTPPPAATPPPPPPPATGIVTLNINSTTAMTAPSQTPTFAGTTFGTSGAVGTYDKIRGTASGTLDPKDPKNAVITDIALAPVDANGLVEYNMDFYILKPSDLTKGNHKVFFELPNRGTKQYRFTESVRWRKRSDDCGRCGNRIPAKPGLHRRLGRVGNHRVARQ